MIDDIRWLEIPAAEWSDRALYEGGLGIYDEATRTVRVLQVKFAGHPYWGSVPVVRALPVSKPMESAA